MELIEGSETSANHNRTPGKYPKEYIHYYYVFVRVTQLGTSLLTAVLHKAVPAHATKAYRKSRGITALILNLDTRGR